MSLYFRAWVRKDFNKCGDLFFVEHLGKSRLSTFVTYYEEVTCTTKCLAWPRMGGFDRF